MNYQKNRISRKLKLNKITRKSSYQKTYQSIVTRKKSRPNKNIFVHNLAE